MTPETIQQTLTQLAEQELGLAAGLNPGDLANQLDSVARLTLVVAIEDHFKICFEPEDEERIHGINDIVEVISRKLGKG